MCLSKTFGEPFALSLVICGALSSLSVMDGFDFSHQKSEWEINCDMKNKGYNPTRTGEESCALESSSKQSLFFLSLSSETRETCK